jgi:hypothetical protein
MWGCPYCTRAHSNWSGFDQDVDDVVPLANKPWGQPVSEGQDQEEEEMECLNCRENLIIANNSFRVVQYLCCSGVKVLLY